MLHGRAHKNQSFSRHPCRKEAVEHAVCAEGGAVDDAHLFMQCTQRGPPGCTGVWRKRCTARASASEVSVMAPSATATRNCGSVWLCARVFSVWSCSPVATTRMSNGTSLPSARAMVRRVRSMPASVPGTTATESSVQCLRDHPLCMRVRISRTLQALVDDRVLPV